MNAPTRREKVEAMLAEDPSDQFLRYSLALELEKEGQHDRSLAEFGELMSGAPLRTGILHGGAAVRPAGSHR